jgi:hypothetical protein
MVYFCGLVMAPLRGNIFLHFKVRVDASLREQAFGLPLSTASSCS